MNAIELKECPNCQSLPPFVILVDNGRMPHVECTKCGVACQAPPQPES